MICINPFKPYAILFEFELSSVLFLLASRSPGVPVICCQSPHICVKMIMCSFNITPLQPFLVLLRRDCVDHLGAALGYRRRGEPCHLHLSTRNSLSSSAPHSRLQRSTRVDRRVQMVFPHIDRGRRKRGPDLVCSIHHPTTS